MDEKLAKALKEMEDRIKGVNDERYIDFQKRLDSLQERDSSPTDISVIDIQKYMDDKDIEIKALDEEIRLLKTNYLPSEDVNTDDVDFKGWFFKDKKELEKQVHGLIRGDVRTIDTGLFVSDAGKLSRETSDKFIDMVVEEQATLSRITTRKMEGSEAALDELRVTPRKMILGVQSTAPAVADSISHSRHDLDTVEALLAEDISLWYIEDNIAKQDVEAQIAGVLAKQVGSDLNDLGINGDTTTGTFLVINDGFVVLFRADTDVSDVALAGASTPLAVMSAVTAGMPNRFLALPDIAFWSNPIFCQAYANEYATRETASGDAVMINGFPNLRYFGRPVYPEPNMVETTVGIVSSQVVVMSPASNLVHGIQRNVRIDAEWNARKRVVEYTISIRNDYEYGSGEPVVLGDGLIAALRGA